MTEMKKGYQLLTGFLEKSEIEGAENKAYKLLEYMDEILEANSKVNLTAITDREEFIMKHLLDSLACVELDCIRTADRIIDVGTGGGFPGVPLAIAFPEKDFILLDSLRKRINIIDESCSKLGITNVEPVHGRAEDLARTPEMRESFDLCVSRAVATMSTLSELCIPFVRRGGYFLTYKGSECESEVEAAAKAIELLGGTLRDIIPQPASHGMDEHKLVIVEKVSETDPAYPRRAGKPAKDPLR